MNTDPVVASPTALISPVEAVCNAVSNCLIAFCTVVFPVTYAMLSSYKPTNVDPDDAFALSFSPIVPTYRSDPDAILIFPIMQCTRVQLKELLFLFLPSVCLLADQLHVCC